MSYFLKSLIFALLFSEFILFSTSSTSQNPFDVIRFLKSPHGIMSNLVLGGWDHGQPVYLSRLTLEDGSHVVGGYSPRVYGDNVYFAHGGIKRYIPPQDHHKYNVEYAHHTKGGGVSWLYSSKDSKIDSKKELNLTMPIGTLSTGEFVYACRAFQEDGMQNLILGRYVANQGGCAIHVNDKEVIKDHFEVMGINYFGLSKDYKREYQSSQEYCIRGLC